MYTKNGPNIRSLEDEGVKEMDGHGVGRESYMWMMKLRCIALFGKDRRPVGKLPLSAAGKRT